jgi:hypothetical protein
MKLNGKQIALIVVALVIAFVINWALWWIVMRHPGDIQWPYHALVTICLGATLVLIADSITKADIFK